MITKKKYYFNLLIIVLRRLIFRPFDNFLKNTTEIIHIDANIGQERNHYKKYKIKKIISRFLNIYNFIELRKIKIDKNKNDVKVFDILYSKKKL